MNVPYPVLTLAVWIGAFFALRTVYLGLGLLSSPPGPARSQGVRSLGIAALIGAVGLACGALIRTPGEGMRIPIVWFQLPFSIWIMILAIVAASFGAVHALTSVSPIERNAKLRSLLTYAALFGIGAWTYSADPAKKSEVLTGGITVTPTSLAAIILAAVAATAAMVYAQRTAAARGWLTTIINQLMLITGSIIFGIPFAFLLITSFKEDRDMSSPNGIVWVPRVQRTVPYLDPKRPTYETTFKGQTIQGTILEENPDGSVQVDISKPLAIRGTTFSARRDTLRQVPVDAPLVTAKVDGQTVTGMVVENFDDGRKRVQFTAPSVLKGQERTFGAAETEPVRDVGLRWQNYTDAFSYLPPETLNGLVYLKNTLLLVVLSVVGTLLSSAIVAYAFSRLSFPGKNQLFTLLLATMMLPGAVTLLPQFLIFRNLGWIDSLYPLWVPAFFGSAFNIFMLRQFFMQIPMELEDASKIDGCTYFRTFWDIMMPQIKPALAVIAIWTFMGAWNNFMGPLIYVNSPENMPLSYALQLFQGDRAGEPGLLMAFATMAMLPVLALFFFAQKYFIEGVTLSGLGGR
ncbi:MAG: carbohydrate ABC transporter permease [Fimbriimonadaceae bacterium]|nr:carbohydrate ABC transporter permease [Fimbriimonadaceae bacterium]